MNIVTEKPPTHITRIETLYSQDLSHELNSLNNARNNILKSPKNNILDEADNYITILNNIKTDIKGDSRLREHIKVNLLKELEKGLSLCKDFKREVMYDLGLRNNKRFGNYKYVKKNLSKYKMKNYWTETRLSDNLVNE